MKKTPTTRFEWPAFILSYRKFLFSLFYLFLSICVDVHWISTKIELFHTFVFSFIAFLVSPFSFALRRLPSYTFLEINFRALCHLSPEEIKGCKLLLHIEYPEIFNFLVLLFENFQGYWSGWSAFVLSPIFLRLRVRAKKK